MLDPQQSTPPDTLPANFFQTQPGPSPPPAAPSQSSTAAPPPDTLPADFFQKQPTQADTSGFDTSSLGPNFKPDYSIDVYAKAPPPDAPPVDWGPNAVSVPMYNYPVDPATGQRSTQLQPMTVHDRPLSGFEQALMAPLDYEASGMQQLGQGLAGVQNPQSPRQVAGAASDIIRGGMQTLTPFILPEMLAKPIPALIGMGTYGAAQQAIEQTATHLGLKPEYAKLAGDIGGLFGGQRMYQWLADMARIPEKNIANGIYQKIEAHMAALQDPTLDPGQRAASRAAVDALLTSLRAEEGWKLPALFPNPNQQEREAYKYIRDIGAPPNAGAASGSPFVRGAQWLSGMTPAGAVMDVGAKRQTVEALKTRASGLLAEAAPPEGPAREFYSKVDDAVSQSAPVNVPLGVENDGSIRSGDVKVPVDLRDLKADMQPLWDKLQFMPMKDQSSSHAYAALKVLMNSDEHITAPTAEWGLSGFKKAALLQEGGIAEGLTKTVIPKLQGAIDSAVKEYAGDDAATALQNGRRAAAKEFGADWLNEQFTKAQQEGGFSHGRQLWNNWTKLTESAKRTMFNPAQVAELNKFFHGVRMIEENPNPSGTALAGAIMAQAGYAMHGGVVDPLFWLGQLGAAGTAKLLRSDLGVKLLSDGISIPRTSARGRYVEQQLKNILGTGEEPPEGPPAGGGSSPPNPPQPPASSAAALRFSDLPEYARRSIMEHSMEVQTNEGRPDPYAGTQWERATVPILSLKKANAPVFTWDWKGFRGSKTEGPIVLSHDGEIIDGNNRLYEAIKRGEGDIEVYRPTSPLRGGTPPLSPAGSAAAPSKATLQEGASNAPDYDTGGPENRQGPEIPPSSGTGASQSSRATSIPVPGSPRSYEAHYAVKELGDIQPSHNGLSFAPNEKYGLVNDRDYRRGENQFKILHGATGKNFDPRYLITDNPDAGNGPPVIDSQGNVLGGNGRGMILQRVYAMNPAGAQAYKNLLAEKAGNFGLNADQVRAMKQPVLVREIPDTELTSGQAKQGAVTDFNVKGTAELRPSEKAIADSRRVSQQTLDDIGARLDAKGPDGTLAEALEGKGGADVLRSLISDGAVPPQEAAAYASDGKLTPAGKTRISQAILGRFFHDPAQMDRIAPSVRNKLERIAAPLARVETQKGWNLTPHIQAALDLLEDAAAHGDHNLDDYVGQAGLFAGQSYLQESVTLAKAMRSMTPTELTRAARAYAQDARFAAEGTGLFGEPPTPAEAFAAAFSGASHQ